MPHTPSKASGYTGQFYKGDSSFILDIADTVRDGRVYEGRGEFANTLFDVLYTIEYGGY